VRILVTGGAGYIGSVVTAQLLAVDHEVTVLDDLSTGHRDAVSPGARFVEGDIASAADVLAEIGPWEGETTEEMFKFLAEARRQGSQRLVDG